MTRIRASVRTFALFSVFALAALAGPSVASAQASRTWVSGVGDDVNPCSRTAPCKTFAGAISKTAAGGEINAMDDGGYGTVTITKSITIDGHGHQTSTLASGATGFIVNTTNATDKVTIRNVTINGTRKTASVGVHGIRFMKGSILVVENVRIFGFGTTGILMENNHAPFARMTVTDTSINDCAIGINLKPGAAGIVRATIRDSRIDDNGDGVVIDSTLGGTAVGVLVGARISDSGFDPSGTGYAVHALGAKSYVRIKDNEIQSNKVGLKATSGGIILSAGDNAVFGNGTDGVPTGSFGDR